MILFSQRLKLRNLYLAWCEKNNVSDDSLAVITFLVVNDLINDEKVEEFLKGETND